MKLIDKDALVAEIERRQKIHFNDYHINGNNSPADYGACSALTQILAFVNTLEAKEVDLEKESLKWVEEHQGPDGVFSCIDFAKHFFELGLKAQKEE